ncbi:PA14 domain-containing protein [Rhodocytophaga aerolata]|uniref:PA14 domain-containing protein n=1 Tax=Rhodocytophaga aerolata TaxID=455078 RepID=A0ABT8R4J1_9BACT|nr:PA14 domain-containing protein [Rhodocytophaga aerolata]MDO1446606.1 PA14 domain-containing protein [Rhodocytophaga aerolata]
MKYTQLPSLAFFALSVFAIGACNTASEKKQIQRPTETWVLRSVLDKKPRMLSIALHDKLFVAYDTKNGSLYKAWTGGINFDGPVYTTAHGPQPTSLGATYLQESDENPWRIIANGQEVTPTVNYKGHAIADNQVTLKYELDYQGQKITVEEKPEFVDAGTDKAGFERTYTLANVPSGVQVGLDMHLTSITSANDYQTNGKFNVSKSGEETLENKKFASAEGMLLLNNNGTTTFTVNMVPRPVAKQESEKKLEGEEAVMAIMAKSDCNTCHNKEVKTVGPAYIEIAKKYPKTEQITEQLVTKVIAGGAGNWGEIPMTPHPNLSKDDAKTMVSYILDLDAEQEGKEEANKLMPKPAYEVKFQRVEASQTEATAEKPGIAVNVYQFGEAIADFPEINGEMLPVVSGTINALHINENDFGGLQENFTVHATGVLTMEKTTNVVFRLVSDDGSRLYINNKLVIDHGGNHGLDPKDGEMLLKAGKHPFRIEYFQGGGGKGLSLQWQPYGTKEFVVVPPQVFTYKGSDIKKTGEAPLAAQKSKDAVPGDAFPLEKVHPSFTLAQARPDDLKPKVGGMDFLPDGRLVVCTWDSLGSVYVLEGVQGKDPKGIKAKRIAYGLAEPLGLKVVDGEIYVQQKQELTKLVDLNKDDIIDEYQTICNGWRVSANFHEFAFGLVYKDGYFYSTLATAINPGGASTKPQIPDRGKVVKISKKDGSFEFIASGLRTPNGIAIGVDNEIFIADNQGDWLPSSKILHLQEGAWYGSRSVDFEGTANAKETLPVVWLPQDEVGNSPSQPALLNVGPYKNQMIHGEVTNGGIKRVFVEKVNGQYQGAVFHFTQGLEAGVNRLVWGPDGALYVGGVGSTGNWSHANKLHYGLQKLTFNDKIAFEMLAVRAKANGVEIEFTEPLQEGSGTKVSDYLIRQWYYKPTENYGGPKLDDKPLNIQKVTVSSDRKKVFLQLAGMKPNHVVYVRLNYKTLTSQTGQKPWVTEAWYTMNTIPTETSLLSSK